MFNYLVCKIKSQKLKRFILKEDGAVTVEFVVLSAAVVVMGGFLGRAMNAEVRDGITALDVSGKVTETINN